ncbi:MULTISPECIES: molybdopterin-dependent oxidoreductase [Streptomyces]|uniref:Molybdopterin-dependent oxidoreductase n=1 Tax=Streptomyces evansiae TaxID=3075535 RepID=A0ABU2R1T0_9ACTN|nr:MULTISPECIES: molybdopterin-dependent oxidoreductase [unclassified Streptomyces]MDT0410636.1 molybdopterin-dependent oxidoreductase [Streptomyces sp. DSM 41979]MYQ61565.1 molybdopterin-dependent oxidoreductase [Streptomyces sp. SID4926]SCE54970.1 Oxidoreductase molybdopterin binding domain-containing protein [Streptomyces sp. DfronAA-171]
MRVPSRLLPSSPGFWRSPLRGPRFTSVLGLVLLVGVTVMFVTGLLSYAAYNPGLGGVNDRTPDKGLLGFYLFDWPTDPYWLYRLTQGVHVTLGVTLIPVLLAKLWSVVPKLFALPPVRSLAHALERITILLLVGGGLFEFTTGVLNVQLDYLFPGSFYPLHFYGAWLFFAAFLLHAALRVPLAVRTVRRARAQGNLLAPADEPADRPADAPADRPAAGATREQAGEPVAREADALVATRPDAPTVSRRGALWSVAGGSLLLLATTAGQSIGGSWRRTALLAPHGGEDPGSGPGAFQVNKTAAYAGITTAGTREDTWRLELRGPTRTVRLSRAQVRALPQYGAALPIACVEGWSTSDQHWRGVRLRDLAALAGEREAVDVYVESLQTHGTFRHAWLRANQVADPRSLLALEVNGADLTPDHGYPARVVVPAAPGVLNTKWVTRMTFGRP